VHFAAIITENKDQDSIKFAGYLLDEMTLLASIKNTLLIQIRHWDRHDTFSYMSDFSLKILYEFVEEIIGLLDVGYE